MSVISYAQNFEDVLLARVFSNPTGFYIDIGAAHPVSDSVTKLFYDRGWHGINFEPDEDLFRRLCEARPRDLNLNAAVSSTAGEIIFYQVPSCIGWATISAKQARVMKDRGIELVPRSTIAVTLADVCGKYVSEPIDFLKIDVEGAEGDVLLGADFSKWRPRVVVVEATEQGSRTPNHAEWESLLFEASYLFAHFDGLNRYYVRCEDRDLIPELQVPVNCFDDAIKFEFQQRLNWMTAERDSLSRKDRSLTEQNETLIRANARLSRSLTALKSFNAGTREQLAGLQSLLIEGL